MTLPRPDIAALNINYRRIPILSIGRDVYVDTRLILAKLESLYPDTTCTTSNGTTVEIGPPLSAKTPETMAIQQLLSKVMVDSVFAKASALIPVDLPVMNDPKFTADRQDFSGRAWSKEAMLRNRPEALANIREVFRMVEETILSDGRKWMLGEQGPGMCDVEGVWVFHWLVGFGPGGLAKVVTKEEFPRVWSWVERFDQEMKRLRGVVKVGKVGLAEVEEGIRKGGFVEESQGGVDERDPLGLKVGEEVEVWPIDSGFKQKDRAKLVKLSRDEVVIEKKTNKGEAIKIHAPRWGFRIQKAGNAKL